jgi:hypothetical protein
MGHKVVIYDIDDVLMPWAEEVHKACAAAGLTQIHHTWTSWCMWEDYGCSKQEWLDVVNSLVVRDGIYHGPPYPGALEGLLKLWYAEHEIHLVTARGFFDNAEVIRQWTQDWVDLHDIPATLWFRQDKGAVAREIGATHGIDDRYENVLQLQEAGVDAYLMTQPHNVHTPFPAIRRVDSAAEFAERLLSE